MTADYNWLIAVLAFAGPAWLINMSLNGIYVVKSKYPDLVQFDLPIDDMRSWRGKRILGNSTTWAGFLVAVIVGIVASKIFRFSFDLGLIYGLSVYFGHALGSLIKRRFGYTGGDYMPIVDHGDYIFLTGLVLVIARYTTWPVAALGLGVTLIVHPLVTYLSYKLKLKKYPL